MGGRCDHDLPKLTRIHSHLELSACGPGYQLPPAKRRRLGKCGRVMWRPRNDVLGSAIAIVLACACLVSLSAGIIGRVRQEKNEADAKQRLQDIRDAESTFRERHSRFGTVADLVAAGLLAPGSMEDQPGFRFEFSSDSNGYAVAAIPATRDDRYQYVGWSFFVDESGLIRGAPYGEANRYRTAGRADMPVRQP